MIFEAASVDSLHEGWREEIEAAGFRYDPERAEKPIKWIEKHFVFTSHKDRRKVNTPIRLPHFWKAHIRHVFGWVDATGNRMVRTCYGQTPKKQAKSTVSALIALYLLFMDSEPDANIVCGGRDKVQAGLMFGECTKLLKSSPTFSKLLKDKTVRMGESYNYKLISFSKGVHSGKLWVASSDVGTAAGQNLSAVVFDEASTQDTTALFDILTQGSGLQRSQPLAFLWSNAGIIGESPLQEKFLEMAATWHATPLKDRNWSFYPVIYGLPPEKPESKVNGLESWQRKENWIRANPAVSDPEVPFMSVEAIQAEYLKAMAGNDRDRSEFRRLMCGQQVSSDEAWIDPQLWDACAQPIDWTSFLKEPCWAGLDVSSKQDFTAFCLIWQRAGIYYLKFKFWYPSADLDLKEKKIGQPLQSWAAKGFISLTEGEVIEEAMFDRHIMQTNQQLKLSALGYDPAYAVGLAQRCMEQGVNMIPVAQTAARLNEPILRLEDLVKNGLVRHDGNPVMSWMMRCVGVKTDGEGRKKIVKPDRRRHVRRVDGAVAAVMALDQVIRAESMISVYETQKPVVLGAIQ